jgi:hypothetical protein
VCTRRARRSVHQRRSLPRSGNVRSSHSATLVQLRHRRLSDTRT